MDKQTKKLLKRYRNKRNYLIKQGKIDIDLIPKNIYVKDFNQSDNLGKIGMINKMEIFVEKNSQKMVKNDGTGEFIPLYYTNIIESDKAIAKERQKRYKDKYGEIGKKEFGNFKNFFESETLPKVDRSIKKMTKKQLKEYREHLDNYVEERYYHELNDIYKENYLNKLKKDITGSEKLHKKLSKLSPDVFAYAFFYNSAFLHIGFLYDEEVQGGVIDYLEENWDDFMQMLGLEETEETEE